MTSYWTICLLLLSLGPGRNTLIKYAVTLSFRTPPSTLPTSTCKGVLCMQMNETEHIILVVFLAIEATLIVVLGIISCYYYTGYKRLKVAFHSISTSSSQRSQQPSDRSGRIEKIESQDAPAELDKTGDSTAMPDSRTQTRTRSLDDQEPTVDEDKKLRELSESPGGTRRSETQEGTWGSESTRSKLRPSKTAPATRYSPSLPQTVSEADHLVDPPIRPSDTKPSPPGR